MSELPEKLVEICVVRGVEGPSIYIDDFRMAGNKPWGGGQIIYKWQVKLADFACVPVLAKQIAGQQAETKSATEKYAEEIRFNGELQKRIADQQALIEQLVEGCQAGIVAINELLSHVNPVLNRAGIPSVPPPPIEGIREAIKKAGGKVYETAKEASETLAAAKGNL